MTEKANRWIQETKQRWIEGNQVDAGFIEKSMWEDKELRLMFKEQIYEIAVEQMFGDC